MTTNKFSHANPEATKHYAGGLNSALKVLPVTISKRNCALRKKSGSQIFGQRETTEENAAAKTREIGSARNSLKS